MYMCARVGACRRLGLLVNQGYSAICDRETLSHYAAWFPHAALRVGRWKLVWCRDVEATSGTTSADADHYWLCALRQVGKVTFIKN